MFKSLNFFGKALYIYSLVIAMPLVLILEISAQLVVLPYRVAIEVIAWPCKVMENQHRAQMARDFRSYKVA